MTSLSPFYDVTISLLWRHYPLLWRQYLPTMTSLSPLYDVTISLLWRHYLPSMTSLSPFYDVTISPMALLPSPMTMQPFLVPLYDYPLFWYFLVFWVFRMIVCPSPHRIVVPTYSPFKTIFLTWPVLSLHCTPVLNIFFILSPLILVIVKKISQA